MGSDSKKSSANVHGAAGGGSQIPAAAKKIVLSLKEIVDKNYTDAEIYAVLLDCNMNIDDAALRLVSQDTFQEVKSKRERRKEVKETQESCSRNNNGASSWGVWHGSEHATGRSGSTENNYNELGKALYKRENGATAPLVSSSSTRYRAIGKILKEKPSPYSDSSNADNRRQSIGAGDTISSTVELSSGVQPSWSGVSKGHFSMADIVRGGPLNKGSKISSETSYAPQHAGSSNLSRYSIKPSQISSIPDSEMHQDLYSPHPSTMSETIHDSGMTAAQLGFDNKWPVIEDQTAGAGGSSVFDASTAADAEVYSSESRLHIDRANLSWNSQSEVVEVSVRDVDSLNLNSACIGSDSAASRQIFMNVAGEASNDDLVEETNSCDFHGRMHKHQEGISNSSGLPFPCHSESVRDDILSAVSSAAANLQQLNIGKEDLAKPLIEGNRAVVLPNYLQAFAADCSHLSFGTYKSGVASAPTMPTSSNLSTSDLDVSAVVDGSSALHLKIRNSGYQDDEQLGLMHDTHKAAADSRNYESRIPSQPELMKQDTPETTHEFMDPLSLPASSNRNAQQLNSNLNFLLDPNARNLPLQSEMLSYSKPIATDLLASNIQSLKARDSSPYLAAQSVPTRYNAAMSSINSSSISMSEILNSGAYSLPPPASPALPSSNLAKRNVLPQHLSVHPYSQQELSLRELANMTGYLSMPQSQTHIPSALPQVYPDSIAFHDSLARMNYNLSQYRSGATNSMPLPSSSNAGYGGFVGSSPNLHESFLHNLSPSNTGTAAGYNDLLRSRLKDGNVIPHQQNNGLWDIGNGSRTMSSLPESTYYSLTGQNMQHAGYQQTQHSESLGYRSRTGTGREQQLQNLEDFTLTDNPGNTSQQLNQFWRRNY